MPPRPFEDRFIASAPQPTNAQEAATRIYNRDGILVRSDPLKAAADRNGNKFATTKWHQPKPPTPVNIPAETEAREVTVKFQEPTDVFSRFRKKILERAGAGGIQALGRNFRVMDRDRSGGINAEEMMIGLGRFGLDMPTNDIQDLIQKLDKDGSGKVSYEEMLVAVRGAINPRRQKMIDLAYDRVLDKNGDGYFTIDDINRSFDTEYDPDVLGNRLSCQDALENFLQMFDTIQQDGIVTRQEFTEYYRNVSASVDNDDYFELMIRNAWHIPGGEGWCENTANTRVLVVLDNGTQKVVMIENDLGLDFNDYDAVMTELKKQGITNVVKWTRSSVV